MKKIIVSLTAASLIVASAVAADKGIDVVVTGQTAVYYQTTANNGDNFENLTDQNADVKDDNALFNQDQSKANVGVQLNLDADLKNDFTFGSQLTYLGTTGLEKNLVGENMQGEDATATSTTDALALTQINVSKKIANTTVKVGRQELPMSLSPLAFSEDWNIFKNTFDAALVINSDIPNTTLVGAYVGGGTGMTLKSTENLVAKTEASNTTNADVAGTAYMITAQNKSIPMTTVTGTFYDMSKIGNNLVPANTDIGANAVWGDVAIADKSLPMGLALGLQAGQINPDSKLSTVEMADTTALGAKASIVPVSALTLTAAYTTVSGDDDKINVAIKNVGTGVKTPLYTQMVLNQDAIALDANTFMLKAAYSLGDFGTITAQGTVTDAGKSNQNAYVDSNNDTQGNDFTDLELIYTVKAGGVNFLAAYVHTSYAEPIAKAATNVPAVGYSDVDALDTVRLWARYNF